MAKDTGFWTPERLAELLRLYKKKTPMQLIGHFDRSAEDIQRAYYFALRHKEMMISTHRVKKNKRTYRVTVYRAGYAYGAESCNANQEEPLL